jgi:hypothetical protein
MLRLALRILTTLSTLLLLASIILWFRSHLAADAFVRERATVVPFHYSRSYWSLTSADGRISLQHATYDQPLKSQMAVELYIPEARHSRAWHTGATAYEFAGAFQRAGHPTHFGFGRATRKIIAASYTSRGWQIVFPWPAICALFLVPTLALWHPIRRFRQHRRKSTHRCLSCGYDLRATPTLCPECGKPAPIVLS